MRRDSRLKICVPATEKETGEEYNKPIISGRKIMIKIRKKRIKPKGKQQRKSMKKGKKVSLRKHQLHWQAPNKTDINK